MSLAIGGFEIVSIARECRADFDAGRVTTDELEDLYRRYLSDQMVGLRPYLEHVRPSFPKNNCQLATLYLLDRMGQGALDDGVYIVGNGIRKRQGHSFLNLGQTIMAENTIVDITADQFGGPAVYVGSLEEPWVSGRTLNR